MVGSARVWSEALTATSLYFQAARAMVAELGVALGERRSAEAALHD